MKRISEYAVGLQQGSLVLFSAFADGGEMWTGTGPRAHRQRINFNQAFVDTPVVHVALTMWDIGSDSNQRADISAEDVDIDGFTVVFRTWEDTRVARVRVSWLAIGPTPHEDDWEL